MKYLVQERGDTLVEVIFALIILTSVLVATFTLGRLARGQSSNAAIRTQAVNLMQEQYEALRNFRDLAPTWYDFEGPPPGGPPSPTGDYVGIYRRFDAWNNVQPAPNNVNCSPGVKCFHMERDSLPGSPNYGQWVTCPGAWYPPLDYDNTWSTATNPAVGSQYYWYYDQYYGTNLANHFYGCQGNARTHDNQPNIQVSISVVRPVGPTECPFYEVSISGDWPVAGTRPGGGGSHATSTIYSYIGNTKSNNQSPCD